MIKEIRTPDRTLGIPRSEMPQVDSSVLYRFVAWLETESVDVSYTNELVAKLKMIQNEFDARKVDNIIDSIYQGLEKMKPIIISKDNYVLDGTHRMLAMLNFNNNSTIEVIRIGLDAIDAIDLIKAFKDVKYRNYNFTKIN